MRWEWLLLIPFTLPAFMLGALRHELSHGFIYKLQGGRLIFFMYPHEREARYDARGNGPIGYVRRWSFRFWRREFRWTAIEAHGGKTSSFVAGFNSVLPLLTGLAVYVLGAWVFWRWGAAGPLELDLFLGALIVAQGVDPVKMLTGAYRPGRTDLDLNKWIKRWRLPRVLVALLALPVWAGCAIVFWAWILPAF